MELFDAAMVSVSSPLAAVMGIKTVLMAVMRLDVVSYQIIQSQHGNTYCGYRKFESCYLPGDGRCYAILYYLAGNCIVVIVALSCNVSCCSYRQARYES